MKIQCDMCEKKEASVYCTADEASLCDGCDLHVHHANKLANKHPRLSLRPSSDEPPRCDICQERKAFMFCKEDRAILCRDCEITIHSINEHSQNHTRFLLAGVKLSNSSSCYDNSSHQAPYSSISNESSESGSRKSSVVSEEPNRNNSTSANDHGDGVSQEEGTSMEASIISEYLTETLPGWHVEEFLDPYGFYEAYESSRLACMGYEYDPDTYGDLGSLWSEDLGSLVNSTSSDVNSLKGRKKMKKDQQTVPLSNPSSMKRPTPLW